MNDTHTNIQSGIEPYLDGELTRERADALETHVSACAICRDELESSRALRVSWTAPSGASGPSLWPEVHARVVRERSPGFRAAMALAVAASLLVGVLAGVATIRSAPLETSPTGGGNELWSSLGSSLVEAGELDDYFGGGGEATP